MPNYPTHSRWGRIGAVVMTVVVGAGLFVAFSSPFLAVAGALAAGMTTFVGAIFPDIDHHNSIPRRKAVRGFQILVLAGVVALALLSWDVLVQTVDTTVVGPSETVLADGFDSQLELPPEFIASAGVLLFAVALTGLVDPVIGRITGPHRGWTHSVPITLSLTAVLAGVLWLFTSELVLSGGLELERRVAAVTVLGTFFVGILIHLGLDGEIR